MSIFTYDAQYHAIFFLEKSHDGSCLQTNSCAESHDGSCLQTNSCAGSQSSSCLQTNSCAGSHDGSCLQTNSCAGSQISSCLQTNSCTGYQQNSCLHTNSTLQTNAYVPGISTYASSRYDTWCKYFASNRSLKNKFSSISSTPSIHADYSSEIQALSSQNHDTHSYDTVY